MSETSIAVETKAIKYFSSTDLTMTEAKLLVLSLLTNDYMHSVVDLVRHGSLKEPINISSKSDWRKKARELSTFKSRCPTLSKLRASKATENGPGQTTMLLRNAPGDPNMLDAIFIPPPTLSFLARQPPLCDIASQCHRSIVSTTAPIVNDGAEHKKQRFPFLHLPPELRNAIYRLLLTTLELPRITRDIAIRAREWTKCRDSRSKRAKFKSLFLEILQTWSWCMKKAVVYFTVATSSNFEAVTVKDPKMWCYRQGIYACWRASRYQWFLRSLTMGKTYGSPTLWRLSSRTRCYWKRSRCHGTVGGGIIWGRQG